MSVVGSPWFRKYGRYALIVICTLLISTGVYIGSGKLLAITTIEVASSDIRLEIDERKIPRNLLFFPAAKIAQELRQANPLLADITFQKKFPHTLVVVPHVRKPIARLHGTDRRVLVDHEGMVLGDDDGTGSLPLIELPIIGLRVGGFLQDPAAKQSIAFVSHVSPIVPVEKIVVHEERYLAAQTPTFRILFTQETPAPVLAATLQTLILGFRIKGTLPTIIDLRFDKPIVQF